MELYLNKLTVFLYLLLSLSLRSAKNIKKYIYVLFYMVC